jgi:hypothetical protein
MEKRKNFMKAFVLIGLIIGAGLLTVAQYGLMTMPESLPTYVGVDKSLEWHTEQVIRNENGMWITYIEDKEGRLVPLGDYDPTGGAGGNASGWLNMFLLDYGQTGETSEMKDNSTDWNTSGNAMGYAEIDNWNIDIVSEDPFRFCVKAQFNETHIKDSGTWNHSRARVRLTVSGDETISAVYAVNNSGGNNDAVMTGYSAGNDLCYIIFYWDDGSDGYRITDDGTLTVSEIRIEARY